MNKFFKMVFAFFAVTLVAVFAFAQDLSQTLPVEDAFRGIMAQLSVGGLKGLALVAAIVQCVMFALRTSYGDKIAGKWKLAAVYLLSMAGGIIALKMQGMDWVSIVLHSNTLAAIQIFGHQVVKQATEEKKA